MDWQDSDSVTVELIDGSRRTGEIVRTFTNRNGHFGARVRLDEPVIPGENKRMITAFDGPRGKFGEVLVS